MGIMFHKVIKLESMDNNYKDGELLRLYDVTLRRPNEVSDSDVLWFEGKDDGLYRWQVVAVPTTDETFTFSQAIELMKEGYTLTNIDNDVDYRLCGNNFQWWNDVNNIWEILELLLEDVNGTYILREEE